MSDKVIVTKAKLTAIADEIRSKLESADTYTLDDMPDAIDSISGGGIPNEVLESHFDFVNDGYTDLVRNLTLDSNMHGNISIVSNEGLVNTQAGGWCRTLFALNPYQTYRIEIEFGDVEPNESLTSGKKAIINYGRNGNTDNFFGYDFSAGKFYCKSGSGNQFSVDSYNADYLDNKKVTIYAGCNFVNGVLTKTNDFNLYFYVDGDYMVFGNQTSIGDIAQLGFFRSSDGFYNATIKNCKVYRLNNLPEAAV